MAQIVAFLSFLNNGTGDLNPSLWKIRTSSFLHRQCHCCWWPGDTGSQGISFHLYHRHSPLFIPVPAPQCSALEPSVATLSVTQSEGYPAGLHQAPRHVHTGATGRYGSEPTRYAGQGEKCRVMYELAWDWGDSAMIFTSGPCAVSNLSQTFQCPALESKGGLGRHGLNVWRLMSVIVAWLALTRKIEMHGEKVFDINLVPPTP